MHIEIDNKSGFCFGVQRAITKAEELIENGETITCLGEMVHNHEEVDRLEKLGMKTIEIEQLSQQNNQTILIRSHGEPPSTYQNLNKNNNKIIDATCPVVLKLQQRIKNSFEQIQKTNGQLLIYGKKGHAEVIGLNGQTGNKAIIVSSVDDLKQIDFSRPIEMYSQTTMPLSGFNIIKEAINKQALNKVTYHDTICRQVANRVPHISEFAKKFDIILFVSGKKSSNGKLLFDECKKNNPRSYFISSASELDSSWFRDAKSIGICGATSTPQWLMEQVKNALKQ
ncbi:MAG TPA: 4-hydroxy-3-methylbut-2-enyl diphosphate reductase [Prolixibacteraceae bacterium]|nr:4-hydroxy-3-methylbut-2-enyl diphosphate reductase [Prolixibacteraceae bacterium]